jgi:hypothetical protein
MEIEGLRDSEGLLVEVREREPELEGVGVRDPVSDLVLLVVGLRDPVTDTDCVCVTEEVGVIV